MAAAHEPPALLEPPAAMLQDPKQPCKNDMIAVFRSDGFADYMMDPSRQRGKTAAGTREKAQQIGERKADHALQRCEVEEVVKEQAEKLKEAWIKELERCASNAGIKLSIVKRLFVSASGGASEFYSIGREIEYRNEIRSKVKNKTIERTDPYYEKLMAGIDPHVDEVDFICSEEIAWGRPSTLPNQGIWQTRLHKENRFITWGRTKMTSAEQRLPDKDSLPARCWVPANRDLIEKVRTAIPLFFDYMRVKLGDLKGARNQKNTIVREAQLFTGNAARRIDAPRDGLKRERADAATVPRMAATRIAVMPLYEAASQNPLHADEFREFAYKWQLMGCVAASSDTRSATKDSIWYIISQLDKSDAMVYTCDFDYEKPDGMRMRNVDEKVSYVSEELAEMMHVPGFSDSKNGKTMSYEVDGQLRYKRVYTLTDAVCELHPYAARMNTKKFKVSLDVSTLFAYYPELYRGINALLENWNNALCSDNGGCAPSNIAARRAIVDDLVYGPGKRLLFTEYPPMMSKSADATRLRRLRFGECTDTGGTLSNTGYILVREYKFGDVWALWNDQSFWVVDECEIWHPMPIDSQGYIRAVGWMEGDDAPPEQHDYAQLDFERGMLPDLSPLLPPMFE